MTAEVRIAMWSGPRTRSTALLRSWENRPDTTVEDEPLYAYYLANVPAADPGRDEVLANRSTDWREVVGRLTGGPLPADRPISYQKHMAQHLLPAVDRSALRPLRHAFLIRHPAEMLRSYAAVQVPEFDELGMWQQLEIFRMFGGPVVDSGDILRDPEGVLRLLCAELAVPFTPAMLSWPAGRRTSDGVWGRHWYQDVWASTGFASPPTGLPPPLPAELEPLLERSLPIYEELHARRLTVQSGSRP